MPLDEVEKLSNKLKAQRGITITHQTVPDANHFFEKGMDELVGSVKDYVKMRMEEGGR